jgi:hypothetical protein
VPGSTQTCASFNGTTSLAYTSYTQAGPGYVTTGPSLTVECWMFVTALPSSTAYVFGGYNATLGNYDFQFAIGSNGQVFFISNAAILESQSSATGVVAAGNLYHVVCQVTSSTTHAITINNASIALGAYIHSGPNTAVNVRSMNAGAAPGNNTDYFSGKLQYYAVYPQILTAPRIAAHYNAGLANLTAGTATAGSVTTNTVAVSAGAATNGTSAYTYQWQQSTNSGTTWANSTGAGVTTLAATIGSLTAGTAYQFRLQVTDAASVVVFSNTITATTTGIAASYAWSGVNTGAVGLPSGNITLTPNGVVTSDTVTFSDGIRGGTFNPTSLTWTNSSSAQSVTYAPLVTGTITLSATSAQALSFSPATRPFTSYLGLSYLSVAKGLPTGFAGSATVSAWATSGASAPGAVSGASVGTPYEATSGSGTYSCVLVYPSTVLPAGTFPWVHWVVNSQVYDDANPKPQAVSANTVQFAGVPVELDPNGFPAVNAASMAGITLNQPVSGNVPASIAGYATGQDPATLVLGATLATYSGTSGSVAASIASGGDAIAKNQPLSNFPFYLSLTSDPTGQTPATGLAVTARRSLDGAAFALCAGAVSEIGQGWYQISLAASDLNGDFVSLSFTASGANAALISVATQS